MTTQMIPFEYLALAKEATHGTAVTPPTHYANLFGTIVPQKEYYEPEESRGILAARTRTKVTRKWGTFSGEGPLDLYLLPVFLHGIVKGGTITPTTPDGAEDARLWTFKPTMNADNLDTFTMYFGDPNMTHMFQGAYGMIQNLSISNDATSTDGATISIDGITKWPSRVTPPTAPTALIGPLVVGLNMALYLDTTGDYGTTLVAGKLISVDHAIEGALDAKYRAAGPGAVPTYTGHSINKRGMVTTVTIELNGFTELALFEADDVPVKCRVVHNGPLIEDALYHNVTVDTFGQLRLTDFGDESNTRTATFEIHSEYDSALGADWQVVVQNDRATL